MLPPSQTEDFGSTSEPIGEPGVIVDDLGHVTLEKNSIAEWRNEASSVLSEIQDSYPNDFTAAELDEETRTGTVYFASTAPQDAQTLLSQIPEFRVVVNTGASVSELDHMGSNIIDALAKNPTVLSASAERTKALAYQVSVQVKTGMSLDKNILTSIPGIPSTVSLELVEATAPVIQPEDSDGGLPFLGCTMSLPTKKNTGPELALLTAGHCSGSGGPYAGIPDFFNPVQPFSVSTTTAYPGGDTRWNWSKYMLSGKVYTGVNSRVFGAARQSFIELSVCKYGATAGYACDQVTSVGVCGYSTPPETGGTSYKVGPLSSVSRDISQPGDSGGPWFSGGDGYGIHYGKVNNKSAYTVLPNALNRFNMSLWTGL
ncbi:hypothetical protein JT358_13225 [Micrococcales bacterium 31B]|nr:hypothetical protein [Micrococcales bacterium 31B]